MNFVIPMAGRGQRFVNEGYTLPKMLIKTKGKSLLEWSLDSLPLDLCTNLIFIALKEHEDNFNLSSFVKNLYGSKKYKINFLFLDEVTRGQAETVLKAKKYMHVNLPLLIYNIDTCFFSNTITSNLLRKDIDGVLGSFVDMNNSNKYSFAKVNESGYLKEVKEKIPISNNALTGLYHFRITNDFIRLAQEAIQQNETHKGEFYIAPLYNKLIKEGKKFILDACTEHHILGTPEELKTFDDSESITPTN